MIRTDRTQEQSRVHQQPATPQQLRRLTHWIDGRPDAGDSDRYGTLFDPAAGKPSAEVPLASAADVDRAVAAAARAFPEWSQTPLGPRTSILFRFR
jgi:malonate-semialdehyde dehydrogenase (acetylating)/methylmalonate-semialdehyde dehydrogenase